jgi:hypothetical protein
VVTKQHGDVWSVYSSLTIRETLLGIEYTTFQLCGRHFRIFSYSGFSFIRNGNKLPPYAMTVSKEVRNAFRRFMAKYPEKHDYSLAQVGNVLD